jgi:hypothetical protein
MKMLALTALGLVALHFAPSHISSLRYVHYMHSADLRDKKLNMRYRPADVNYITCRLDDELVLLVHHCRLFKSIGKFDQLLLGESPANKHQRESGQCSA